MTDAKRDNEYPPHLPYILTSEELAERTSQAMKDGFAAYLSEHGNPAEVSLSRANDKRASAMAEALARHER